jgi:L-fuculose-phosphate aldolase
MLEKKLRAELMRISVKTYDRGLVGGTGGNLSARLDPGHMLITPSGVALGDTAVDNIVKVNMETGQWTSEVPFPPSKESKLHAEIYRARGDVEAVIHCHPPYATAYAVRRMDIPYVTDAAFKQPPMPHVDFSPSGSEALAHMVGEVARRDERFRVMILDEHGIISVGADLVQAYNFADLAEELARIAYLASTIPR